MDQQQVDIAELTTDGAYAIAVGTITNHPVGHVAGGGNTICRIELLADGSPLAAVARGELVEPCSCLARGQRVRVRGRLLIHNWRQANNPRHAAEIKVEHVEVLP